MLQVWIERWQRNKGWGGLENRGTKGSFFLMLKEERYRGSSWVLGQLLFPTPPAFSPTLNTGC